VSGLQGFSANLQNYLRADQRAAEKTKALNFAAQGFWKTA